MDNMDDFDDDFGDLYAEVEVQATSAINNVLQNSNNSNTFEATNVDVPNNEDEDDSEDELNIVLDDDVYDDDDYDDADDDDINATEQNSSGGNVQFKNTSLQTPVSSANGVASHSPKSKEHLIASSLPSHTGCCYFSLPRSRTILDVNIDSLEHKPWNHPGADITDYFNFSFNEDTWKHYCNQLDTLRHQRSDGRYLCKFSRHNKELKAGTDHEDVSHKAEPERSSHPAQLQSGMISGSAIHVEECVIERLPSRNIWGRLDRDSDVVIQITLQDDLKEDILVSANEGESQTEVDYDDTVLDEAREILCLSAGEDELSSLEGDSEKSGDFAPESGGSDKQSPTTGFVSEHQELESGNGKTLDADVGFLANFTDAAPIGEENDTTIQSGGRPERRISDAAPSAFKPRLNQDDQRPHSVTPPSPCSHRDYGFDTYADLGKSSNKVKLNLPNYLRDKRDSVTCDYYLFDHSKKYGVKSKHRDHQFCSSSRRALQPYLSCHGNKPIYLDDDASHFSTREWNDDSLHSTYFLKYNGLDSHAGKKNSYYKTSKSFPDYGDHKLSNCDSRDRYMKRPCCKGPSSEYDLDHNNRDKVVGKKNHAEQRPGPYHKEGRQGRLFNEKRHALSYIESQQHSRFRHWQRKTDCYLDNEVGNKRKTEKHDWPLRKYVEHDDLVVQSNYGNSSTQADHRKPVSSVGIRESVQHIGDDHLSYSRREVESFGWSSGGCGEPNNGLNDMQYAEYDDEKGGCTRFWSHDLQIRPRSTCRQRLSSPRAGMDQTHSRNRRNSTWAEKCYNNDHLGNYYFLDADVKMRYVDNQVRRRDNEQRGVSRWNDKHFKSQPKDNEVLLSEISYPHKRDPSRKSIDSQHGLNHFGSIINHSQSTRGRFRITRGKIRGQLLQNSNVLRSSNYGNAPSQFRSSIDSHLADADRKNTGRSCGGGKLCNVRNESIEDNDCMKLEVLNDSNVDYPVKANCENLEVDQHGKFSNVEHNESEEIEEGQILTEELKERAKEEINSSEDLRQIGENKNACYKNAADGNEVFKEYGNPRIQEILAKMERRRERFKRSIVLEKDTKKETLMPLHTDVETCNSNPQRPTRKRRWDGNNICFHRSHD